MIKKALRTYLSNDATLMTNVSNVFTYFNPSNTRRVNNPVNKSLFPMITISESDTILNEGHYNGGTTWAFQSEIQVQLDTIVEPDGCSKKQIDNLTASLDEHEESADRIIRLLHGLSGNINGVLVGTCAFADSSDSALTYNLVNNDKDQIVYRKTFNFNINYEQGA